MSAPGHPGLNPPAEKAGEDDQNEQQNNDEENDAADDNVIHYIYGRFLLGEKVHERLLFA